jgi:hypothetical protein
MKMTNYLNANPSAVSLPLTWPHNHLSLITGAFMALNSPSLMKYLTAWSVHQSRTWTASRRTTNDFPVSDDSNS